MKWQGLYYKSFKWHRWFAWHPIPYGQYSVWLQFVWRKRKCEFYECTWIYEL